MVAKIKKELQTPRGQLVLFVIICTLVIVGWVSSKAASSAESNDESIREITLEVSGMAFNKNNPTIHIRPGETVRFVISNLDPGIKHNFIIDGTDVQTPFLNYGETVSVTFTAPVEGTLTYYCSTHASMMNGRLQVLNESLI